MTLWRLVERLKAWVESKSSLTSVATEALMALRWIISSALFNWPMCPRVSRRSQVPGVWRVGASGLRNITWAASAQVTVRSR